MKPRLEQSSSYCYYNMSQQEELVIITSQLNISLIYHIRITILKSFIETFHQVAISYLVNLVLHICTVEKTNNRSFLPNIDPLFPWSTYWRVGNRHVHMRSFCQVEWRGGWVSSDQNKPSPAEVAKRTSAPAPGLQGWPLSATGRSHCGANGQPGGAMWLYAWLTS